MTLAFNLINQKMKSKLTESKQNIGNNKDQKSMKQGKKKKKKYRKSINLKAGALRKSIRLVLKPE